MYDNFPPTLNYNYTRIQNMSRDVYWALKLNDINEMHNSTIAKLELIKLIEGLAFMGKTNYNIELKEWYTNQTKKSL